MMREYSYGPFLFKVYRKGHAVFKYVTIWADDLREAMFKIDDYAYDNGYIDFEYVEE